MTGLFSPAYGDTIRDTVQKPAVMKFLGTKYKRILDTGSGSGFYTALVKADQKISLDYSLENVKTASKLPKSFAINGDAQDLPLKNNSFDAVLCLEVLEHLKRDQQALKEIKRVLKKNGKLILSVPLKPAPITDTEHVREGYTPESIKAMLKKEDFQIENEEYCMLIFSRIAFKLLAFFQKKFKVRPPAGSIKLISTLDFLCLGNNRQWRPYDIVLNCTKK